MTVSQPIYTSSWTQAHQAARAVERLDRDDGAWCHRRFAAEWWHRQTGQEIVELDWSTR